MAFRASDSATPPASFARSSFSPRRLVLQTEACYPTALAPQAPIYFDHERVSMYTKIRFLALMSSLLASNLALARVFEGDRRANLLPAATTFTVREELLITAQTDVTVFPRFTTNEGLEVTCGIIHHKFPRDMRIPAGTSFTFTGQMVLDPLQAIRTRECVTSNQNGCLRYEFLITQVYPPIRANAS